MANAIILAAGYGMRMVPINRSMPKGLIKINGEYLIERLIMQLNEAGINEIVMVTGFMKEQFQYLSDKYNINIIENNEYENKNNLHSLNLAASYLKDSFIIPSDIWCRDNPFLFKRDKTVYLLDRQM